MRVFPYFINHLRTTVYVLFFIFLLSSCEKPKELSPEEKAYIEGIEAWHKRRIDRLISKTGWLSLVGLYWLKEGENTFGGDQTNFIKFPKEKSPDFMGSIYLEDDSVRTEVSEGVTILFEGNPVRSIKMKPDISGYPTILSLDSLSWYVIKRGERFAVRLRDSENENIQNFSGIEIYPIDTTWRVEATLEPYNPPKLMDVPNITGTISEEQSPGALVFNLKGIEYRLDPIGRPGGKSLFVIFADQSNGYETYGAGRFVYATMPGSDGKTILDFNKAYNPPCAFTRFATCPLPPKQNVLPLEVTAGEKNYDLH
jgi:uncharacterized protein (DUF1684 family)